MSAQATIRYEEPIVVVEENDPNDTAEPADTQPSKSRLVIRVVIPQEPAPQSENASRLNTHAIALSVVVITALILTWVGFSLFSSDPSDAQIAREAPANSGARSELPESNSDEAAPAATDTAPAQIGSAAGDTASAEDSSKVDRMGNETSKSSSAQQTEAPPSPIDQVIPDVPRSALQTIRGTVRVAVQVSIGKEGNVLAATSKNPGPSRYFERLSLQAAKKWTFTPSVSDEEAIMLIRFHYTQEGATVHPSLPDE